MRFLIVALFVVAALSKEKSAYEEFVKEKEGECPLGRFIEWNSKAKRCQKKIESGDTKFVRTKCCINQIKKLEAAVDKQIEEVKKNDCPVPNCPFVYCLNGEIKQYDAKGCVTCPKCKAAPAEDAEEKPASYEGAEEQKEKFDVKMAGEWWREDGSNIIVAARGDKKVHLTGEILDTRVPGRLRTGDFQGEAVLEMNGGAVKATSKCFINFEFVEDFSVLKISQGGSDSDCGFGMGVWADGDYTKKAPKEEAAIEKEEKETKKEKNSELVSEKVKEEAMKELYKEIEAEEIRKEAAKEEEEEEKESQVKESGYEAPPVQAYETEESEIDSPETQGCMKKCYYRKYEGAKKKQINCAKLHRYAGRRDCFKGGEKVKCSELKCQLVHEVKVEKKEVTCRRVCYYRPYAGSRIKKRIPCRHVDTKYVGDKKCAVNGKRTPCRKLTCK